MIPTPHKIEILKSGKPDIWGNPVLSEILPIEGNVRSLSRIVTNAQGEEVVSNFTILFIGFVDVKSNDLIRFTEPNGEIVEATPIQIKFMRDLDGSVAFTKVVL